MSYQIGGGGGGPSGQSQQAPEQMRISTTQTVTVAPTRTTTQQPTLRLRGEVRGPEERTEQGRRIQWAEDVVDNEGLGRKSSKGVLHPSSAYSLYHIAALAQLGPKLKVGRAVLTRNQYVVSTTRLNKTSTTLLRNRIPRQSRTRTAPAQTTGQQDLWEVRKEEGRRNTSMATSVERGNRARMRMRRCRR